MRIALLRNPLFVTHVVHVDSWVTLKFVQAVNGAEIERFRMIVMAGCGISNADFHFADWIDRHGRALLINGIHKWMKMFSAIFVPRPEPHMVDNYEAKRGRRS
jgi:hypothetical protein